MKTPTLFSFFTAFAVLSCSKSPIPTIAPTPTATPVSVAVTLPPSTHRLPVALASSASPAPTPSEHQRLAPEGILYLIQRAPVTTNTGVIGFSPGTRVQFIEDRGAKLLVSDGTIQFEVPGDIVTNDLDIAETAARLDTQSQEAIAKYLTQQADVDRGRRDAENLAFDRQQREASERRRQAAIAASDANKLERGAYHEIESPYYPFYYYHPWIYRHHR